MAVFTITIGLAEGDDGSTGVNMLISDENVTDVTLTESTDPGSLDTFSFTVHKIKDYNAREMMKWCRLNLRPNKTLVKVEHMTLGTIFYGIVYSFKESFSNNGSVSIICQDLRGLLRNGYVMYDPEVEDDEDDEDDEDSSDGKNRGNSGETVAALVQKIGSMYNNGGYGSFSASCSDKTLKLKEDVSIEGSSILDALRTVAQAADCEMIVSGFDTTVGSPFSFSVNLVHKIIDPHLDFEIKTGLNLLDISLSVDSSSITTGIAGYGGHGYNNHRLSCGKSDTPTIVYNEVLQSAFGNIVECKTYDSIVANTPEEVTAKKRELSNAIQEDVDALIDAPVSFSASAVDLFAIIPHGNPMRATLMPLRKGLQCFLKDEVTNAKLKVRVSQASINLSNLANSSYTFEAAPLDLLAVITESGDD